MDFFFADQLRGVVETGLDIRPGDVRIMIPDDLLEGQALPDKLQDAGDRDACALDAGLAEVDVRIDDDALYHAGILPYGVVVVMRVSVEPGSHSCRGKGDREPHKAVDGQEIQLGRLQEWRKERHDGLGRWFEVPTVAPTIFQKRLFGEVVERLSPSLR
jgi:hypothetical protein